MKPYHTLLITALAVCSAQAAVVVTDDGTTAPTLGANDTGSTGSSTNRFGFRLANYFEQTFTLGGGTTLGSIYTTYTTFDNLTANLTITVDAGDNGSNEISETVTLNSADFVGNTGDSDGNPHYWMKWDLSSHNLSLPDGTSSFKVTLNSHTDPGANAWIFAPTYSTADPYAGGQTSWNINDLNTANTDMSFAVTTVPEPSVSILLGGLSLLGVLRRRRS